MGNSSLNLKAKWNNSALHEVYNLKDVYGRGRFCMMLTTLLAGAVTQMTSGLFLTGYLLLFDMDKASIGVVSFIPYMTSLLSLFSPMFLERFSKRRWILILMKLSYYAINILGITVLPQFIKNSQVRIWGFITLFFIASAINQLAGSGWTAWQANFLPESIQLKYFQISTCISSAFANCMLLVVAFLTDAVSGTEHEMAMIVLIRMIAMVIGIVECAVWLIPKEFPYLRTERIKFSNIFVLPLKNKRFMRVMILLVIQSFAVSIPQATLYAWLLEDIQIGYTTYSLWGVTFFLFFIVFSRLYSKIIEKLYLYKGWALENFMHGINKLLYVYIGICPVPIFWISGLFEHFWSAFGDPLKQSLVYVVLPDKDRTYYLSFHQVVTNSATFLGMMVGTLLAGIMGDSTISILGYPFSSTQICIWAQGFLHLFLGFASIRTSKILAPKR